MLQVLLDGLCLGNRTRSTTAGKMQRIRNSIGVRNFIYSSSSYVTAAAIRQVPSGIARVLRSLTDLVYEGVVPPSSIYCDVHILTGLHAYTGSSVDTHASRHCRRLCRFFLLEFLVVPLPLPLPPAPPFRHVKSYK